jgi:hypothetical protein
MNELKISKNEDFDKTVNEKTILKNLKDRQYKSDSTNNYISKGHYLNVKNIKEK